MCSLTREMGMVWEAGDLPQAALWLLGAHPRRTGSWKGGTNGLGVSLLDLCLSSLHRGAS